MRGRLTMVRNYFCNTGPASQPSPLRTGEKEPEPARLNKGMEWNHRKTTLLFCVGIIVDSSRKCTFRRGGAGQDG